MLINTENVTQGSLIGAKNPLLRRTRPRGDTKEENRSHPLETTRIQLAITREAAERLSLPLFPFLRCTLIIGQVARSRDGRSDHVCLLAVVLFVRLVGTKGAENGASQLGRALCFANRAIKIGQPPRVPGTSLIHTAFARPNRLTRFRREIVSHNPAAADVATRSRGLALCYPEKSHSGTILALFSSFTTRYLLCRPSSRGYCGVRERDAAR